MKVYRIRNDVMHYQYLLLDDPNLALTVGMMDCQPKSETWKPPKVYSYKPFLKRGDFWGWELGIGALVTTPEATELLRPFLGMAGELLPLPYEDEVFTILNVTECINCLSQEETKWRYGETTGAKIGIEKYVFHTNRFSESVLFKIPETHRSEILVVEGLKDPEEEFRYVVEQSKLEGLIFEKLWEA